MYARILQTMISGILHALSLCRILVFLCSFGEALFRVPHEHSLLAPGAPGSESTGLLMQVPSSTTISTQDTRPIFWMDMEVLKNRSVARSAVRSS